MKIILCDINPQIVESWRMEFIDASDVEIHCGSIFDYTMDALVSPANSFGFMDGGFDYLLSMVLGWNVQAELQKMIAKLPGKELLVGNSLTVKTGHQRWPYLISAPTMRVPMILGQNSVNIYLASLAIFNELKHNPNISSIGVTGLGTGVGQVPPKICAHQMREAYTAIFNGVESPSTWQNAQLNHQALNLQLPRDLQNESKSWN